MSRDFKTRPTVNGVGVVLQGESAAGGGIGLATLNFGAFPGAWSASVDVTGQTAIVAGSLVRAWMHPANTVDHNIDEHLVDPPRVIAANIVQGTGFTIYGFSDQDSPMYGAWSVAWEWN